MWNPMPMASPSITIIFTQPAGLHEGYQHPKAQPDKGGRVPGDEGYERGQENHQRQRGVPIAYSFPATLSMAPVGTRISLKSMMPQIRNAGSIEKCCGASVFLHSRPMAENTGHHLHGWLSVIGWRLSLTRHHLPAVSTPQYPHPGLGQCPGQG
jgi:hypothetical protein